MASTQNIKPTPTSNPDQDMPGEARLSLDPAGAGRRGLSGGWWPRSRDAAAELPGLLAELSTRTGRVSRIALQADAFSNIPHQLTVGGRKVHVAWFRHMNMHTVSLTMADREYLTLLVVPPSASPAAAAQALGQAASGRSAGPPEAILAGVGIEADGDPGPSQADPGSSQAAGDTAD
jgi:Family of unknown function (DUF5994)